MANEKTTVYITDFGAQSGSKNPQTEAIQSAIDYVFKLGGGEVRIPSGEFVSGDITLRSNITLHFMENAVIKGSLDPNDYTHIWNDKLTPIPSEELTKAKWFAPWEYPDKVRTQFFLSGSYWNYGLIRAVHAENIEIIGEKGSLLDGQNVYDPNGEEHYRGPHCINMHHCKNIKFSGYTVKDSGNWGHALFFCENISADRLTVLGGHDAFHTRVCTNVSVSDCTFKTGDDAIAGFDNINVTVKNCVISSSCNAFRYGGRNILVENCDIFGPCEYKFRGWLTDEEKINRVTNAESSRNNMLSLFTYFVSKDFAPRCNPGNIVIRSCNVKNPDRLLHLNLSGNEVWQVGIAPDSIVFEDCNIDGILMGSNAYGDEGDTPFVLTFRNVNASFREGAKKTPFINGGNFTEFVFDNVKISNITSDCLVLSYTKSGKVTADNLVTDKEDLSPVRETEDKFETAWI